MINPRGVYFLLDGLPAYRTTLKRLFTASGVWLGRASLLLARAYSFCQRFIPKPLVSWFSIVSLLLLFHFVSQGLFHLCAVSFSIVVALFVNTLAARTYRYSHDYLLLFGGTSLVYVAMLDAAHLFTFPDFPFFRVLDEDTAHQFWMAARLIEAGSLLLLPAFVRRHFRQELAGLACLAVTFASIVAITPFGLMPRVYGEAYQPTAFTTISAGLMIALNLASIARFWLVRSKLAREFHLYMSLALALILLSNLFFFFRNDPSGVYLIGHLLRVSAYCLFYRAFVGRGLDEPYGTIFAELKDNAMLDPLTGICNRQGWIEYASREIAAAENEGRSVGILLMDVDNFKQVNDNHGHLMGDEVLRRVAEILRGSIRNTDIVCRLGGDEFAVIVRAGPEGVGFVQRRIREAMDKWVASDDIAKELGLSIGCAMMGAGHSTNIDALLAAADHRMYQEKSRKKSRRDGKGAT